MSIKSNCDDCMNFAYDDEMETYVCEMDLDEDEMYKFIRNSFNDCPYFRMGDDYTIVKKQI